jgi:tetratricopeptide (TPR) repeat protein
MRRLKVFCFIVLAITAVPDHPVHAQGATENQVYLQLARQPSAFTGRLVHFTGKVVQSVQNGKDYMLRVDVTEGRYGLWQDTVYVEYRAKSADQRILEKDIIDFRGTFVGIKSYQAVLGQTIQIPHVIACEVHRVHDMIILPPGDCQAPGAARAAPAAASPYDAGLSLLERGDYDRAVRAFTTAIEQDPSDVFPYLKRALAYEKKGDRAAAIADYELALTRADKESQKAITVTIKRLEAQ